MGEPLPCTCGRYRVYKKGMARPSRHILGLCLIHSEVKPTSKIPKKGGGRERRKYNQNLGFVIGYYFYLFSKPPPLRGSINA